MNDISQESKIKNLEATRNWKTQLCFYRLLQLPGASQHSDLSMSFYILELVVAAITLSDMLKTSSHLQRGYPATLMTHPSPVASAFGAQANFLLVIFSLIVLAHASLSQARLLEKLIVILLLGCLLPCVHAVLVLCSTRRSFQVLY